MCITFVYFCIYETKGLTLEEVDELYNEVTGITAARRSTKWTPKVTFTQRESVAAQGGVVGARGDAAGPAAEAEVGELSREGRKEGGDGPEVEHEHNEKVGNSNGEGSEHV